MSEAPVLGRVQPRCPRADQSPGRARTRCSSWRCLNKYEPELMWTCYRPQGSNSRVSGQASSTKPKVKGLSRVRERTEWNKAVYRTNWADNGPSSVSPTHCDGQVESCWGSQFGQFKPCTAVLRYDFAAFLRFHVYAFMISHQIINKTCY